MVSFDVTTVCQGVGERGGPERGKLEILMAAADWSDGVMTLSNLRRLAERSHLVVRPRVLKRDSVGL